MSRNKKGLILSVIGILGLIVITVGVTYAFFNYVKEGTTENSITSGTVTFLYTEVSEVGRGIRIQDAYPMSDEIGKVQVGEGKVFDFKITSNTSSSTSIPYEVTARKKSTSTLDEEVVKLYLTEVDGSLEEEVLLDNYSNLVQTTRVDSNRYIEKTIYEGIVPANSINYEKNFRLRMWIDESTDFSAVTDSEGNVNYPYNGKEFTLTVNVYANGKIVTVEEGHAWDFAYTGGEQAFTIPNSGYYQLETWGAQGGNASINTYSAYGGFGGYSSGKIRLEKNTILYINVGGQGQSVYNGNIDSNIGYNGGNYAGYTGVNSAHGGGGGATSISIVSGLLSELAENKESILIVSAGGGGSGAHVFNITYAGGNAGGFIGSTNSTMTISYTNGLGGTQVGPGTFQLINSEHYQYPDYAPDVKSSFGQGEGYNQFRSDYNRFYYTYTGGGSGYYGGGAGHQGPGGGGSSYIGNNQLIDKVMYCYNCEESVEVSTRTISTTNVSQEPISNYAKQGNGYVKITYLGN